MDKKVKVSVVKGEDPVSLLDQVLKESEFTDNLKFKLESSKKSKKDFSVVIKPNLMMFTDVENPVATYTDPILVEHLVDKIREIGFKRLFVVESQNCFGNWYLNRGVLNVARVAGFKPKDHGYEIIDLTEEMVPYKYSGQWLNDEKDVIGKTWMEADYRISFAKNKTHIEDFYTLTLKNIYGTNPLQDKMYEYHARREWYGVTYDMLNALPVDFGIIDAFYSSDGPLGFKGTFKAKETGMMLASPSLIAVDMVGSKMMGLKPHQSKLMELCLKKWGIPEIERTDDLDAEYIHKDWVNVIPLPRNINFTDVMGANFLREVIESKPELLEILTHGMATIYEEDYLAFSIGGLLTSGRTNDEMSKEFPMKKWDQLSKYVMEQTIRNIEDLLFNVKRHKSIRWEIMDFFKSITSFFERRRFAKKLDQDLEEWKKLIK
jgi:uncharacterized protein (DUF362 family)